MFSRRLQPPSGPVAALGGLFLGFLSFCIKSYYFWQPKWFFRLISGLLSAHSSLFLPRGFCFLPSFCGFFCFLLLYFLYLTTKLSNQENQTKTKTSPIRASLIVLKYNYPQIFSNLLFLLAHLRDLSKVEWHLYMFIRLVFPHVLSHFTPRACDTPNTMPSTEDSKMTEHESTDYERDNPEGHFLPE